VAITGLLAAFPGVERSAALFPSTAEVVSSFERAGFRAERVEDVIEPWRVGLGSWSAGVRSIRHIDSAFRPLDDAEFAVGLRVVAETYPDTAGPIANDATLRLIVLAR
jgi:hypothetical protein